jgi:hypothetical protein
MRKTEADEPVNMDEVESEYLADEDQDAETD